MDEDKSRAGDREAKPQDQIGKILEIAIGLDAKVSNVENRVKKLEEDDVSTIAFRGVNEAIASEDSDNAEKLKLLVAGFVSPERGGKHKYDVGVEKLIDQIATNMSKLWPSVNKSSTSTR